MKDKALLALQRGMGRLTLLERTALRLRFGLDGGECLTVREIADRLGTDEDRIGILIERALRKLRHPSVYMEN